MRQTYILKRPNQYNIILSSDTDYQGHYYIPFTWAEKSYDWDEGLILAALEISHREGHGFSLLICGGKPHISMSFINMILVMTGLRGIKAN